ncbi:Scr1 family TA system antitoxin-like transcriptional regulator [Streptomonospora wellingtoniae]|uniref:Scr1 family TA system antitoxin-like transcriptional regulator n=1 Tax=Streptomonospora wellingtoniae TaxID=3075544 RepID=UPI00288AE7FC|nr:Scr1 family TA system antitoxin-like transcriptional regulator [Streptomonospora sp. DSM 45055]
MDVRFGRELKRWRENCGYTQTQLARAVPISQSHISAIERGAKRTTEEQVLRFDALLSASGQLVRRWEDSRKSPSGYASWFAGVTVTERESREIREYSPLLIPGLFQTERYARASFRTGRPDDTEAEIEGRVRARMERQEILEGERPPTIRAVVEESVLKRPTGGREVMVEQLERLLLLSRRPRVRVLVIPMAAESNPGQDGGFLLFTVPEKGVVAFVETKVSGMPSDSPDVVDIYAHVFTDLCSVALPPGASRELIRDNLNMMQNEWKKSSYSEGGATNCVECRTDSDLALVRDTRHREAGHLAFPLAEWQAFLRAAHAL